jgi:hypothetical protein
MASFLNMASFLPLLGKKLNEMGTGDEISLPCHMLPYGLNLRSFSRADEDKQVRRALDP